MTLDAIFKAIVPAQPYVGAKMFDPRPHPDMPWNAGTALGPSVSGAEYLREPDDHVVPAENELLAELVERDVAAVLQEHEPRVAPRSLPEIHLSIFERMAAHLEADAARLRTSIETDTRLLADTEISLAGFRAGITRMRRLQRRRPA